MVFFYDAIFINTTRSIEIALLNYYSKIKSGSDLHQEIGIFFTIFFCIRYIEFGGSTLI